MPIFIPIAIGAAGISLVMTVHGTLKQRKWKKIHDERLNSLQSVQKDAVAVHSELESEGYSLGHQRIEASETLEEAAEYLKAITKEYELEFIPEIPSDALEEWINLRYEIAKSLTTGATAATLTGVTASASSALYTAAGLFGIASTGARIAGLSGAAAQSARLAWIGGGAVAAGGGGIALGTTILNVVNVANVVTAPIALAAGIWTEKKAHDLEKEVTAKVGEYARSEAKLRSKMTAMRTSTARAMEIRHSVQETDSALKDLLRSAKALPPIALPPADEHEVGLGKPDMHTAHQIYLTAKTLRELIEQPAISETNRRIIEG